MPELGKATYTLIFDTAQGEAAVAGMEARAQAASEQISASMGNAERSVSTFSGTTAAAAGEVEGSTTMMSEAFQEAGASATVMGEEVTAGSAAAGAGAEAGAAKTAFAWNAASKKMKTIAGKMKSFGRSMTHKVTLPTALVGAVAVKSALDYNEQIKLLETQAGATAKETEHMNKAVLGLSQSGKVTQTPEQLAKALYHLESSGIRGKDALDALTQSAHLATVGHADLEASTDAVAKTFSTGIRGAESFKKVVGTVNATIGAGNMRMDEFNSAMGTGIVDQAKKSGLSLSEVGAALATFTIRGLPATQSMTALRMSLIQLGNPTTKQKDALDALGFKQLELAKDLRTKGLIPTIDLLAKKYEEAVKKFGTERANQKFAQAFGGSKSGKAMLALVAGHKKLGENYVQINKKTQDFAHLTAVAMGEPVNKMKKSIAQIMASLIKLGNILVPIVEKIVHGFEWLAEKFDKLSPKQKKWVLIAIGALAALGPVIGIISAIAAAVGFLITPVGLVILAIAALAIAFIYLYRRFATFRKIVNATFNWLKKHWRDVVTVFLAVNPFTRVALMAYVIIKHWRHIWRWMKAFASNLKLLFSHPIRAIVNLFHLGVQAIKGIFGTLPGFVQRIAATIVNTIIRALNWMIGQINKLIEKVPTGIQHKGGKNPFKQGVKFTHSKDVIPMIGNVEWGKKKDGGDGWWHEPESAAPSHKRRRKHRRDYGVGGDPSGIPRMDDIADTGMGDWSPDGKDKKKKKKPATASLGILGPAWMHLENRLLRAETTKTKKDDRRVLGAQQKWLEHLLKKPGLGDKKRHEALTELVSVKNHLARLNKTSDKTEKNTRAQVMAMQDMRSTFFDQFASNIFHRNTAGKLEVGGAGPKGKHKGGDRHITQNNHYHEIPKDRFRHARQMRKAIQAANT